GNECHFRIFHSYDWSLNVDCWKSLAAWSRRLACFHWLFGLSYQMAGGGAGGRTTDPVVLNSSNVFAALDTLRKKKKSSSSSAANSRPGSSKSKSIKAEKDSESVFWSPAPLTVKSWADVEDEDDDDYYATTAPPAPVWDTGLDDKPEKEAAEESESDDECLDEVDDDVEDKHEHEPDTHASNVDSVKKQPEAPLAPKDSERQLSKKELKKKELQELDAVLAELGLANQESCSQEPFVGVPQEKKGDNNGRVNSENAPGESKSAKKKKKKEKTSKDIKDSEKQSENAAGVGDETNSNGAEAEKLSDASSGIDVKERLKKMAAKKKKSSKEVDAAAKAAASEAAARRAKVAAAAKKKEKSHYNQQPVR
ncbi:hypothetical protein LINPERHAP2_LOCUS25, partial [Linum perenne]